jgi:hypothetical protein
MDAIKQVESKIEVAKAALVKRREAGAAAPDLRAARKRVKRLQRKRRVLAALAARGAKKKQAAEPPAG